MRSYQDFMMMVLYKDIYVIWRIYDGMAKQMET